MTSQEYLGASTELTREGVWSESPRRATGRVSYRQHDHCIVVVHPVVDVVTHTLESQPSHIRTSCARDRNTEGRFNAKLNQCVSEIIIER
ncbi:MAG TPA: hypothetical protein VGQ21_06525 [Thermoanaerobaculia bacterium]|nr:hypothetical protein [Thermoanaerobaculia bacterium]